MLVIAGIGSACTAEPVREETAGTVMEAGAPAYHDSDLRDFLPDHIQEHSILGDDDLQFTVKEGVVSVRGAVDNQKERDELERRVRRVPGVRDVDMSGVSFGE